MNPLASPPSSLDSAALPSLPAHIPPDAQMRALLAATWQVLDQPPPPSLREILAAYKQRGDGDREMLLAMLNAKSAEDQRLASLASLHRTLLEIRQTCEPSPSLLPQLQLPNGVQYPPPQNHYMHPPAASYTPPPPPQPLDYPRHLQEACDALASSSKASVAAARSRPPSSGRPSGSSEPRQRKRARNAQTAAQSNGARFDSRPSPQGQSVSELPPSPYSSASQRSLSSEGSTAVQSSQKPQRAMAINSLLTDSSRGGPTKMEVDRDRDRDSEDTWVNERVQRRSSADNSPRLVKAS